MVKIFCTLFVTASTVTLLSNSALPQYGPLYIKPGTYLTQGLGRSAAGVGDLDKDGHADFAISGWGTYDEGFVIIYSGKNGAQLFQMRGIGNGINFGYSIAGTGDVNNDGWLDFLIGSPGASLAGLFNAGSAFVYSGKDASILLQVHGTTENEGLGNSVAGTGDINDDAHADFIVGAPGYPPGGAVFVYSGFDGSLLLQKNGLAEDQFGLSVATIGDLNNDGTNDFIVGANQADPSGILDAGSIYIYSGRAGELLLQKDGSFAGHRFGLRVVSVGDINHDGIPDFIVGASGTVYVYSGIDGSLIYQKSDPIPDYYFIYPIAGTGDVNGDGYPDFLIASPGIVSLYSGVSGQLLYQKNTSPNGNTVAGTGDVNSDGLNDFIIGLPWAGNGVGTAIVYARDTVSPTLNCVSDTVLNNFPGLCIQIIEPSRISVSDNFLYPTIVCNPPVYRFVFFIGTTQVTCIGTDQAGNKDSCSFTVTVLDSEPPFTDCPSDTTLRCEATVSFNITATDNCTKPVAAICNPPSGSFFPIGKRLVTCMAADSTGNQDSCSFSITVLNSIKGDMNGDNSLTIADVTLLLNCVFRKTGDCELCFADVNCSGNLSPADIVLELLAIHLVIQFPC